MALLASMMLSAHAEVKQEQPPEVFKAKLVRVQEVDIGKEVSKFFADLGEKFRKLKEKFVIPPHFKIWKKQEEPKKKYDTTTIQGRILEFMDRFYESQVGEYANKIPTDRLSTAMTIYVSLVIFLIWGIVFNIARTFFRVVQPNVVVVDVSPTKNKINSTSTPRRVTPRKSATPRKKHIE